MSDQIVNVGPGGTFKASGSYRTTPGDVDAIIDSFRQSGKDKLVVHFHGGLVKEENGLAIARRLIPEYEKTGVFAAAFVWETGFGETFTRNLNTINSTELFQKLLKYALKFAAEKFGIDGKGPGDEVTFETIEDEIDSGRLFDAFDAGQRGGVDSFDENDLDDLEPELEERITEELDADDEIEAIMTEEAPSDKFLSPKLLEDTEDDRAKGLFSWAAVAKVVAGVVVQVIRRYLKKRDHGFYPTVVEEVLRAAYVADLGEWMWGGMKTAAENMWLSNDGLSGESLHAGTLFLEKLAQLKTEQPDLKIDLIGHSAGSIAICHMLRASDALNTGIVYQNILFLAPACTTILFNQEIPGHAERFRRFRMYTMRDDFESEDQLVPKVYTRSLLYFISGVLEGKADIPILGMQRYLSGSAPYLDDLLLDVREFIEAAGENRLALSDSAMIDPDAPEGMRTSSRKHGDFDNDTATLDSLKYLIS